MIHKLTTTITSHCGHTICRDMGLRHQYILMRTKWAPWPLPDPVRLANLIHDTNYSPDSKLSSLTTADEHSGSRQTPSWPAELSPPLHVHYYYLIHDQPLVGYSVFNFYTAPLFCMWIRYPLRLKLSLLSWLALTIWVAIWIRDAANVSIMLPFLLLPLLSPQGGWFYEQARFSTERESIRLNWYSCPTDCGFRFL